MTTEDQKRQIANGMYDLATQMEKEQLDDPILSAPPLKTTEGTNIALALGLQTEMGRFKSAFYHHEPLRPLLRAVAQLGLQLANAVSTKMHDTTKLSELHKRVGLSLEEITSYLPSGHTAHHLATDLQADLKEWPWPPSAGFFINCSSLLKSLHMYITDDYQPTEQTK